MVEAFEDLDQALSGDPSGPEQRRRLRPRGGQAAQEEVLVTRFLPAQGGRLHLGRDHRGLGRLTQSLEHVCSSVPLVPTLSTGVLLVDRLAGHAQLSGDVLPRPTQGPGPPHLQDLELVGQAPEGGHGSEALGRIGAGGSGSRRRPQAVTLI